MNGGVSPFWEVLRISKTAKIAIHTPETYIAKVIASTLPTLNMASIPPDIAVSIGSFAPHEKKGITLMVI